jgi:hypothetical protein
LKKLKSKGWQDPLQAGFYSLGKSVYSNKNLTE